ncbi:tyrosine-type recombinase/integrase [Streptomyces sp. NPDC056304]|uniref:tyrosine-type recombinase/integrase n=1 Tax=Streptomyces sp. NPDC056304 TaxID=3345778 RepID=UPI0035D9D8CC
MLTVWHWTPDTVEEWISEVRPGMRHSVNRAHWPSEREPRVGVQLLDSRFAAYRDAVGLDPALEFHWLRRSYITHLIEDGHDPLFVQQQVAHDHASTTAIYTCVSSDFRTRSLPKSCLIWLRNPNVVRLLRGLTTGTIPLSHKGPHQETPWRTVTHLRDLLMNSSVLPRVDRQILLCQRWLTERLATIENPSTTCFSGTSPPGTRCAGCGPRRRRSAGTLSGAPGQAGNHPGRRLPCLARRPRPHGRALSAGRQRRLAHREARHPASCTDVPPLVHEGGPDAEPHPSAPGHHPEPGATPPVPPTRHAPTGHQRRLPPSAEPHRCRTRSHLCPACQRHRSPHHRRHHRRRLHYFRLPGIRRLKRHRAVATRYDKLAVRYEATVLVAAINEWL